MKLKDNAKNFIYGFFDRSEICTINLAIKILYNWRLKHNYSLKTDSLSPSFKKEVLSYWSKYTKKVKPHWHKYYSSRNNNFDARYMPDDLYYTIIDQHFNNRKHSFGMMDKNYFSLLFYDVRQPSIVVRKINGFFYDKNYNIISVKKVMDLCDENKSLIIKPSVGTGGAKGIKFWSETDGLEALEKYLLSDFQNFVVQKIIVQHCEIKRIHPSSVNTIRIVTLLFKGKVHILSSILRMGVNGSRVDNASVGGITCGIKESGQLKDVAYSKYGIKYERHPQGFNFTECIIPSFDKIKEIVKKQQEKMAHFRLISWDIAIGEDGEPILIEANLRLGDLGIHQLNNGPLFGELTDEVLEEVFGNNKALESRTEL